VVVIPVMIVVMIVPVAFRVPAMPVFIPPFVKLAPAEFARFMQLVTSTLRLGAVPSMMLSCFVKPVVGPYKTVTASVVIGSSSRRRTKQCKCAQRGRGEYSSPHLLHTSHQKTLHESIPPRSAQG
jgi:hypothetical protein